MKANNGPDYSFNIFWSAEDEGYIAICLDVPGISAFGETEEEAVSEIRVALRLSLETYEAEGWELPTPKPCSRHSGQLRFRLPRSVHGALAEEAEREGASVNTLIVSFVSERLGAKGITGR